MAASTYTFQDLSGMTPSSTSNPYDGLLEACEQDPSRIQAMYEIHRETRAAQQRAKLLSPDFEAITVDETLLRLETQADFVDARHCLVFWARPTEAVKDMIEAVQEQVRLVLPGLWLMPRSCLHVTALEITHSLTEAGIDEFVRQLQTVARAVVDFPAQHRARLVKPKITYDAQAMAISFLPANGEGLPRLQTGKADEYSYHHLRRDLHSACTGAGVAVASRYVVPSAHLTLGRFIHRGEFETATGGFDHEKMEALISKIDEVNAWLEETYWSTTDGPGQAGGEWTVGHERGLTYRRGTLWYGGGESVLEGRGW